MSSKEGEEGIPSIRAQCVQETDDSSIYLGVGCLGRLVGNCPNYSLLYNKLPHNLEA